MPYISWPLVSAFDRGEIWSGKTLKEKFLNLNPYFMLQIAFKIGSICIISFSFFVNENQSFALSLCPILPSCSQKNFCPKIFSRVGSERGRLGKVSLYCLSSSLCCHQNQLSPTFPTQTSLLAVGQVLLFEDGKMGEEMVKFKAKKDSGKKHCRKCDFFIEQNVQTAAANVATFGDNWPFKEVSTDFRPALLV